MLVLIGFVVVLASVLFGYVAAHGQLAALWQPFEIIIICGAALGAFMIACPLPLQKRVLHFLPQTFLGNRHNKLFYMGLLALMYSLFFRSRQNGFLSIETHIESPYESELFQNFPDVLRDHEIVNFLTDNYRVFTLTGLPAHELEALMDGEIEHIAEELMAPSHAVNKVAEALPGFGIVAAVLGIVITMGSIGGPLEQIGTHVAAALVGTFLGVFFAYGFVGPLASNMHLVGEQQLRAYHCIRTALVSTVSGYSPGAAVETGRKLLPPEVRPSFAELADYLRDFR
ncbi:flagellar motor stator protein MotA [Marinomonas agarivorans]|nr:flagellar motor stator protein MotA [Marinomonas agarivorans]